MQSNSFKVWDRAAGCWSTGTFMINQKGELREYGFQVRGCNAASMREKRILRPADMTRYGIAWSTGIESIEGQLIHEYDIVAVVGMVPGDRDGYVGEVVYSEGSWWIDSGTSAMPLWSETHKLSVVGTAFKDDIEQWYGIKIPRK